MKEYVLLTKENCSECERAKKFIAKNELNIKIRALGNEIEHLRNLGIRSMPILIEEEKSQFMVIENGNNVGFYLAENMEKFKLKGDQL